MHADDTHPTSHDGHKLLRDGKGQDLERLKPRDKLRGQRGRDLLRHDAPALDDLELGLQGRHAGHFAENRTELKGIELRVLPGADEAQAGRLRRRGEFSRALVDSLRLQLGRPRGGRGTVDDLLPRTRTFTETRPPRNRHGITADRAGLAPAAPYPRHLEEGAARGALRLQIKAVRGLPVVPGDAVSGPRF